MVVIDTSIIIDHLRSAGAHETILMKLAKRYKRNELAISLLSIQELYEGRSTQYPEKEAYMLATVSPLIKLGYDYAIAKRAGEIARDLSAPIELADAAIAATAIEQRAIIATLNTKDFDRIPGIELVDLATL